MYTTTRGSLLLFITAMCVMLFFFFFTSVFEKLDAFYLYYRREHFRFHRKQGNSLTAFLLRRQSSYDFDWEGIHTQTHGGSTSLGIIIPHYLHALMFDSSVH